VKIIQIPKININDYARVRLTSHGEEILKKECDVAHEYHYNPHTKILEIELWSIMEIFGPHIWHGSDQCFEHNEITIIETEYGVL
jgi:hypothetical protein